MMRFLMILAVCGSLLWSTVAGLGEDQCTEGPDFWCSSSANAQHCSANEFCSTQVWTNGVPPEKTATKPSERPPAGWNPCTRGPAFWCATLDNADLCDAFSYCQQHVWGSTTKAPIAADGDGADKQLLEKSEAALIMLFDPEEAAKSIFSTLDSMAAVKLLPQPLDHCDCESCYYLVNLGNSWLGENSTQNLIKSYYVKLCMNVPASMQEHCVKVVSNHFASVIGDLADLDPKKACKDVCTTGASSTSNKALGLPKIKVQDKPVNTCLCQTCQEVFSDLADAFGQKRFQNEFVEEFKRLCSFLPDADVTQCQTTAEQYIPEMYAMMSHLNPAMACNRFKFCENHTAPAKNAEQPTQVAATTKPKIHIPCVGPYFDLTRRNSDGSIPKEIEEVAALTGLGAIPDDDCECESCKYYFGQFSACFKRNATRRWINTFYRKICLDIPASMQEHCTDVVMKHFATLTEDLGMIDSDKACKTACVNATKVASVRDTSLAVTNTCLCQQCQNYIQDLDRLLAEKQYQEDAATEFKRLCGFLKDDTAMTKCANEAAKYIPEMLQMLSNMTPLQTCSHFKYCQKK
ncbi:prosaposin-like [Sycon ciliatum]|uniref:prosaposin-like n=1 Tax=Sycon ciliatum TaxID=27933 RepID=UPI0031F630B4